MSEVLIYMPHFTLDQWWRLFKKINGWENLREGRTYDYHMDWWHGRIKRQYIEKINKTVILLIQGEKMKLIIRIYLILKEVFN